MIIRCNSMWDEITDVKAKVDNKKIIYIFTTRKFVLNIIETLVLVTLSWAWWLPASRRRVSLSLVVVTWHGSIHSLLQLVHWKIDWLNTTSFTISFTLIIDSYGDNLSWNISITRHVAIAIVLDVAVDELTERGEGCDIGIRFTIYNWYLQ